jgi:hypothetical protein
MGRRAHADELGLLSSELLREIFNGNGKLDAVIGTEFGWTLLLR